MGLSMGIYDEIEVSTIVIDETFSNSLIIHKENTKKINV